MSIPTKDARWKVAASDVAEKLREALKAIDYMPNAVANWMEGHGGNRTLAAQNEKKVRQAQALLGEVLASLPASIEYMVVGLAGQTMKFKTREDLIRGLAKFDIKHTGENPARSGHRPELAGQPTFDGLVGPMYGGPGIARYETGEEYDRQSR